MSQRRRQRPQAPVEAPPGTPPDEDSPEPSVEPDVEETEASVAIPQSHVVAYGLTIALIVMLLICALAIYIAAP